MKKIVVVLSLMVLAIFVHAQMFTELENTGIAQVDFSSCALGDLNSDGLPDLVLTGYGLYKTKIYMNRGNLIFEEDTVNTDLESFEFGDIELFDYDNDGDLDIAIDGRLYGITYPVPNFWRNDGNGKFTIQNYVNFNFGGFTNFDTGDCDNDGDLDIISSTAGLYINNGRNNFYKIDGAVDQPTISVEWGDYDNDGDLDILFADVSDWSKPHSSGIMINQGNYKFQIDTINEFEPIELGTARWGDFDNDGFLDVFLAGYKNNTGESILKIYRNDHGKFDELENFNEAGIANASIELGDIDNDGWLDFIVSGTGFNDVETRVYKNIDGKRFEKLAEEKIQGVERGMLRLLDIDNDHDLDLVITGGGFHDPSSGYRERTTKIYINNVTSLNHKPEPPLSLSASLDSTSVLLKWSPGKDIETPVNGIGYSIELVKGINNRIISSISYYGSKTIKDTSFLVNNLAPGYYYWKVKSIDNGQLESEFSVVDTFYIGNTVPVIDHYPKFPQASAEEENLTFVVKNIGKGFLNLNNVKTLNNWYTLSQTTNEDSTTITVHFNKNEGVMRKGRIQLSSDNALNSPYFIEFSQDGSSIFTKDTIAKLDQELYNIVTIGDFDNDNDMDFFLSGTDLYDNPVADLYENTTTGIIKSSVTGIPVIGKGDSKWVDYDNDGDLDLVLTGVKNNVERKYYTSVIENMGDYKFKEDTTSKLTGVWYGSVEIGDFNNDGFYDLFTMGESEEGLVSNLCINQHNKSFVEITPGIPGLTWSSASAFDFDQDMDMDLMIQEGLFKNSGDNVFSLYFKNEGERLNNCSYADLDNDGDLDIFLAGKIYLNDGFGQFIEKSSSGLPVNITKHAWGDYDNDGDLDIVFKVYYTTYLFNNNGKAEFTQQEGVVFGGFQGPVAFVDYNNDNKLDIISTGFDRMGNGYAELYINNNTQQNTPPNPPTVLTDSVKADEVYLHWNAGSDEEILNDELYYNFYIYKLGGDTIISSMSNQKDGFLRLPFWGNAQKNMSWKIRLDSPGTYKWAVQAIDLGYIGSKFSAEKEFEVTPYLAFDARMNNSKWQIIRNNTISWNEAFLDFIKLEYSFNNMDWITIQDSVNAKDISFPWQTPETVSNECFIRISNARFNLADTIKVELIPFIKISNPATNSFIMVNDLITIQWISKFTGKLKLDYRFTGADNWIPITEADENQQSYIWNVPSDSLGKCWIRIYDSTIKETSDSVQVEFTPYLKVISPEKGKQLLMGSSTIIKWSSLFVDDLAVYYKASRTPYWNQIYFYRQPNQDSVEWIIPSNYWEDSCQILLRDQNSSVSDTSGYFYLVKKLTSTEKFLNENPELTIYPNPVSDELNVEFSDVESSDFEIILLDENGRIVLKKKSTGNKHTLNVKHLANGIYFVQLISKKKNMYAKIIIQKSS